MMISLHQPTAVFPECILGRREQLRRGRYRCVCSWYLHSRRIGGAALPFSSFSSKESAIEFTGMKAFCSLCAGVLLIPAVAFAQESILASGTARDYPVVSGPLVEKTLIVEERVSALEITYSGDAPIEMRVSFPTETEKGITYNPLQTLRWKNVPAGDRRTLELDLTGSPAWSPD